MKKMTFALACASTLALFAETIGSVVDFEAYEAPFSGSKDYPGLSLWTDGAALDGVTASKWLYMGTSGATDASTVKAYGDDENLTAPTGTQLSGTPGNNYLELSTEGGTLWRSINYLQNGATENDPPRLGGTVSVGAEGLYIDTMVQFTPTEDGMPPTPEGDDKLAIWLDVSDNGATTNLMVRCQTWDANFDEQVPPSAVGAASFALNADVQAGAWYRLTVKAVPDALGMGSLEESEGAYRMPAFKIFLDGNQLAAKSGNPFLSGILALKGNGSLPSTWDDDVDSAKVFPSLLGNQALTLQAVGFKGSGAIDDLVFRDSIQWPSTPTPIDFTITAATGVTVEWSTDGETWTTGTSGSAAAGDIKIRLTDANGVKKVVTKKLASDSTTLNCSADAFGWADYLGAANDAGAYVIDNEDELVLFQKGCALFATAGETFTLAANIELTAPWAGIGTYNTDNAFKGTFDGAGKTISNVTFADNFVADTKNGEGVVTETTADSADNNYRGFFNQIAGATVKNLTIDGTGFSPVPSTTEYGCALIVGAAYGSTIENCTSKGTIASGTHNVGGIVVRIKDTTVKGCVNEANITGNYTKMAGIVVLNQNSETGCTIEDCVNKGNITAGDKTTSKDPGCDGVAGIVAYTGDAKLTIKNCSNTGAITSTVNTSAKIGQFVGFRSNTVKLVEGSNTGRAGTLAAEKSVDGLNYATVAGSTATYLKNAAVVAGGTYLVTAKDLVPEIRLATGESITFDAILATYTATNILASVEGDEITTTEDGTKTTYTAQTKQPVVEYSISLDMATANVTVGSTIKLAATVSPEGTKVTWVSSDVTKATVDGGVVRGVASGEVTITATAGDKSATCVVTVQAASSYPTYIPAGDTDMQGKFDTWAQAYDVDKVTEATASAFEKAFLLNVAPAEAETAEDAFKILSITFDSNGKPVVTTPEGPEDGVTYNGTIEIQGAETVNGTYAPKAADQDWGANIRFFKAILK